MNGIKTVFLLGALTGLILFVSGAIGGKNGLVIGLGIAAVTNLFSYWFSDKIVLAMYRAKPVEQAEAPGLYAVVERLAARAQMPMSKLYVIQEESPNAFATGRNPNHAAVACTTGILKLMSDRSEERRVGKEGRPRREVVPQKRI